MLRDVRIHFLTQPVRAVTALAFQWVWRANSSIQASRRFVVMGDQFFWRVDGGSNAADLAELVEARGLSAGLLGNPVEEALIPQTGIIETDQQGNFVRIIEKPKLEDAPSNSV